VNPEEPGRRPLPILDVEEQPRPWWRRLLIPAAVVVVAAIVAVVVIVATGHHSPKKVATAARKVSIPGQIVSLSSDQNLVTSSPGGTGVKSPASLTGVGPSAQDSLDGKYISLGDGRIVATSAGHVAMARTGIAPFVNNEQGAYGSEPLSNHDRDLLSLIPDNDYATQNRVQSYSVKTGKSAKLGVADGVSGDPLSAGAFVSIGVKKSGLTANNYQITEPDLRAELMVPGKKPVLLGTAATLSRDVGLSPKTKVTLTPFPSPSGRQVAIAVGPLGRRTTSPSGRSDFSSGTVVLSRSGKLIAKLPPAANPDGGSLIWSPDGTKLAFVGAQGQHLSLGVWTIGQQIRTIPTPFPGNLGGSTCLWSPDGKRILVAASLSRNPNASVRHWAIVSASGGTMVQVTGPGSPIDWLP
jgi:WD40 repeat protein